MNRHANWDVISVNHDEKRVVLKDVGPWDSHLTITNDAEYVYEWINRWVPGYEIQYFDSDEELTRLFMKDGVIMFSVVV